MAEPIAGGIQPPVSCTPLISVTTLCRSVGVSTDASLTFKIRLLSHKHHCEYDLTRRIKLHCQLQILSGVRQNRLLKTLRLPETRLVALERTRELIAQDQSYE